MSRTNLASPGHTKRVLSRCVCPVGRHCFSVAWISGVCAVHHQTRIPGFESLTLEPQCVVVTTQELVEAFVQANAALNDILPAKLQSPAELRSSYGVFQKLYREAIQDIHHAESVRRYCQCVIFMTCDSESI